MNSTIMKKEIKLFVEPGLAIAICLDIITITV